MKQLYISPQLSIQELETENVLCASSRENSGFDIGNHPGGWDNDSEFELN